MKALPPLLAVLVAACGPAAPPPTLGNQPVAGTTSYLVWIDTPDTHVPAASDEGDEVPPHVAPRVVTRWLDGDGNLRGHADGMWLATGGKLWRLDRTDRHETLKGCQERDNHTIEPGTADLVDLALVTADGKDRIQLAKPAPDQEIAELSYDVGIHASLGRYLSIEESTYEYACGAHGGVIAGATTFDLTSRATLPTPWATDDDVAQFTDQARKSIEDPGLGEDDARFHVATTEPVWRDGKLAVHHLLWVDACYACGNGLWSSYTSATWIDDARVPPALAAEGSQVPPAVGHALDGIEAGGVSWGTPDDSWRATFVR